MRDFGHDLHRHDAGQRLSELGLIHVTRWTACVATSSLTGAFGFNIPSNNAWYKINLPTGQSYGPYLVTPTPFSVLGSVVVNGLRIQQTSSTASGQGGYIDIAPITYPNQTCQGDVYGNIVNIPVPISGQAAFGIQDSIIWVSQSPLNGVNPPGAPHRFRFSR